MVKQTENSRERRGRLCGMFLDYWLEAPSKIEGNVLLVGTGLQEIQAAAERQGRLTTWWSWFPEGASDNVQFPPNVTYAEALIRIPPEKERLRLCIEVVAARLSPGATLWLFGSNDEGIRSVQSLGAPFFERGVTVSARKHARLVGFTRLPSGTPRVDLEAFRQSSKLALNDQVHQWHHFPGTFAKGRLDHGSKLLLDAFKPKVDAKRVLDFGCGTGVLMGLSSALNAPSLHGLDRDQIALEAARVNVPKAQLHWSNRWLEDTTLQFDLIISNPPIHDGKIEDHAIVLKLIEDAQRYLVPNGELWMVIQHRVPVARLLSPYFKQFDIMSQNSVFKVWRAVQKD
jgi:16S rRNA (guanine1207-N2)-methyltransferase